MWRMLVSDANLMYIKLKASLYLLCSVHFQFFLNAAKYLPFSAGINIFLLLLCSPYFLPSPTDMACFSHREATVDVFKQTAGEKSQKTAIFRRLYMHLFWEPRAPYPLYMLRHVQDASCHPGDLQ
jgi:hypothetical protein